MDVFHINVDGNLDLRCQILQQCSTLKNPSTSTQCLILQKMCGQFCQTQNAVIKYSNFHFDIIISPLRE